MKIVLLLFLVFFAPTITTVALAFSIHTPHILTVTETIDYVLESGFVQPTGDPIDNPSPPHLI